MKIKIFILNQAAPVVFKKVKQTYTRDGLYCVWTPKTGIVHKYPVDHIYKIEASKN